MSVVITIDAGTTGVRAFVVDDAGRPVVRALPRVHPALPPTGVGGARPGRDLAGHAHRAGRGGRRAGPAGGRHRHHRPARDRGGVGPAHRRAPPPRHRVAGPSHRGPLRRAGGGGRAPPHPCPHRPGARPVLLGVQVRVAADRGRCGGRRAPCARHHRHLAPVEPDRRRGPRHRPLQRQPHHAVRHPRRPLVRRSCATCSACPSAALARGAPVGRACSASPPTDCRCPPACRCRGSPATSRRPCSARPACEPGMAKNTYGTGSFVLMNVGETCPDPAEGLLTTVAWEVPAAAVGRSAAAPSPHYALEGAIFVDRRRGPVAARRAGHHRRRGRGRAAGGVGRRTPAGVVVVPAFTGLGSPYWDPYARGTVLGITRGAGRAHLARAVVESMAFQTRDVVDAMTAASGTPAGRAAGRRRRVGHGPAAAAAGRPARRAGRPRRHRRRRRRWAPPTWPAWAPGVWSTAEEVSAAWAVDARVEPSGQDPAADRRCLRPVARAVERSRDWAPTTERAPALRPGGRATRARPARGPAAAGAPATPPGRGHRRPGARTASSARSAGPPPVSAPCTNADSHRRRARRRRPTPPHPRRDGPPAAAQSACNNSRAPRTSGPWRSVPAVPCSATATSERGDRRVLGRAVQGPHVLDVARPRPGRSRPAAGPPGRPRAGARPVRRRRGRRRAR